MHTTDHPGRPPAADARAADGRAFRSCAGAFATGVTVVAAEGPAGRAGMTLNAFTTVSLDPMLVCVCLGHGSRTLRAVRDADRFAVSVLRRGHEDVATAFARNGQAFPDEHVAPVGEDGHLVVRDALAELRCSLERLVPAGDHDLVIGRVDRFVARDGHPLVFFRGGFERLGVADAEAVAA